MLVLIDSQLKDIETIHRWLPGWKLLHESRPHGTHKRRQFGGITVLWKKNCVRVFREGGDPKGVLSFAVQDAAGRRSPVGVIALYSPPLTSRFNRNHKQWTIDIINWAALEHARLQIKYGFAIVGGDFNWRPGRLFGRNTADVSPGSESNGRTKLAKQWHEQTGLRPLYGQKGQHRGVYTSRTANGEAEVDGVSVQKQMPIGWEARALSVPAWNDYSSGDGVHRPVGALISAKKEFKAGAMKAH